MTRVSTGPKVKSRTRHLLKVLLEYVERTIDTRGEKIQAVWKDNLTELVVKTELRYLQYLTAQADPAQELTKIQLTESLKRLQDFMNILEDHRIQKQGAAEWHFSLKLWSRDTQKNLVEFDRLWKKTPPPLPNLGPEIHNTCGIEHYQADQLPKALEAFTKALALQPNYADALFNRGSVHERMRNFKLAMADYNAAIQAGQILGYNNYARLLIVQEQNYDAAVALLMEGQRALDNLGPLHPNDPISQYILWKNLGWARLGQQRWDEAIMVLEEAIDLCPDQAPAYALLAQCYQMRGSDQAIQAATTAWENFLKYASTLDPDQDGWIDEARRFLTGQ
jgi:tetratricopeptide (TPR) repeat protein